MIRYDHYTDKFVKVSDRECPWCKAVCASTDKYCHECGWHIADTPQTDCDTCRHYKLACELFSEVCKYEPTTQNSNLTFETDTPQTDKDKVVCPNCGRSDYIRSFEKDFNIKNSEYRYKCINCNTYIKDTPQTELTAKCLNCHNAKACKENHWDGCIYEPQTDCLIVDARFKAHCLNCAENGSYKCTKCDGEMYYKADAPQTDCEDIYPLVIIKDRYTGVYSNGKYTAWNMYFEDIPREIDEDDISCYDFWHEYEGIVGLGETPSEAVEDLRQKMGERINEQQNT